MQGECELDMALGQDHRFGRIYIDRGLTPNYAEIFRKPTTTVEIKDADVAKKILGLIEKLEDLDAVQKVYTNFDIPDNLLS